MPRPAKAIATKTGDLLKEETKQRTEVEKKLKGKNDKLKPPLFLSKNQKKIFKFIQNELKESGILGNLDIYIMSQTAICIDRLQSCEKRINEHPEYLLDATFMASKDKYTKDFFRCCNELSLSPQSRAKFAIANVNAKKEEKNPLLTLLEDGEDDDTESP